MKNNRWIFLVLASVLVIVLLAACSAAAPATPDPNSAKPSNPGGTGEALKLTGNAANGATIYTARCAECHGPEGKGGIANEGAAEDVPELNPIDETVANADAKVFAANLDLFIEHGSTPEGASPSKVMLGFGDLKMLQPQEIADVIAYIISLNKK